MNLAQAIEINAKGRPDHVALVEGERRVTYRQLAENVRDAAGRLRARGIGAEDVVGLCLGDTAEHLTFIYALARIGAVNLPMDIRWTEAEKLRVAEHFGAKLVLCEPGAEPLGAIETVAAADLPANDDPAREALVEGRDLPLLLSLSSGTTGRPKGPRITHEQMLRRFWTHWINLGLNSTDRYVSATPLYFGGGRTFAMSVLFAGGMVILFPPPFDAAELCAELSRVSATSTFLVPTQIRKLLSSDEGTMLDPVRALRLLISSGAPLDADERVAIDVLCSNFIEYYASTEGGGVSIATRETRKLQPNSVGRPVFGVEVEVVDDEHSPLAVNTIGRLRYRGPGVASGYFNEDPERETFRDGWFYPGDLAEIDDAGHILLRGRSKDMIIRGGVNIYPGEIETILREHPSIREAAVVGWASARLGEEIAAFVVSASPIDEDGLKVWCRERLAPYKVPKSILQIDDLPRNSAGKVLKAALASRLQPL